MKLSLPDYSQAQVLVVGDVMLDRYWYGPTGRISPEAPVPVVKINQTEERPGGAANVAMNIAALGGHTQLIGLT
ncbi:PfkB family carbohydrate kinase, partial [Klebsiella pneumoniae]